VSGPLVVVDADVLGRRRTGDETYVEQLLAALPGVAGDLRIAALTRRPDLVPEGVEPIHLAARSQELRMAFAVPRLLRRLRPGLAHFLHALPLRCPCPAVVTVQDLSWERDPTVMPVRDRLIFDAVVPRAARKAVRVLAISERTKRDIVELYGVPAEKVVVTPLAVDSAFRAAATAGGDDGRDSFLLYVGAIEPRKQPLLAADAAAALGRRLVVVGPTKDEPLAAELARRGAELRGYVPKDELVRLYQQAACLVFPSRYEGFGLPVLEAMACGTPVAAATDPAMREVAGDAAVFDDDVTDSVRRALADRDRLAAAGLERARSFSWEETARRTAEVYREALAA
jgi:glycosyltransferase involved in cell wall biosynthesis